MQNYFKRFVTFALAMLMILSVPIEALAVSFRYHDIPSERNNYINSMPVDKPAKLGEDPSTKDAANAQIKEPDYPATYTIKNNFKVRRGDKLETNYQPYIATVGDDEYTYGADDKKVLTEEEKAKIMHAETLPTLDGYSTPTPRIDINYNFVKNKAKDGEKVETKPKDEIFDNSVIKDHDFKYDSVLKSIKIKHVFQNLYDRTKYDGEPPIEWEQSGQVGHNMVVSPLSENARLGYEPEANMITVQVPENPGEFEVEYRYNRAKYTVSYNTSGGTDIPSQVLYYGQTIPAVKEPTKIGAKFKGWKASNKITYKNEQNKDVTIDANTLIADKKSEFKEGMPAQHIVFTAVWENNKKADYTVLYYTEKPDHKFGDKEPKNLREKYDFVGARVMENQDTGSTPNLEDLLPIGVTFPDLEGKSAEIVKDKDKLKKYYTYNANLTIKANEVDENMGDGTIAKTQKKVESTGKTVYEVYYDRTVYTLVFERTNSRGIYSTFDPEITVYDKKTGKTTVYDYVNGTTENGKKPYTITARFGESLADKWVRDGDMGEDYLKNIFKGDKFAYISKGYSEKRYSQGWKINLSNSSSYRDVPPYRLTKGEFIDVARTPASPSRKDESGNPIPYAYKNEDGEIVLLNIISLGIAQSKINQFIPHHVDFELEGLDGNYHFHPDIYYWKSDTSTRSYSGFGAPKLKGFTAKGRQNKDPLARHLRTNNNLNAENNNRPEEEKTPFQFKNSLNEITFNENAYYKWRYDRNSYTLNLNSDPTKVKEDGDYVGRRFTNGSSQNQSVKYEKPLADLELPILTDDDKPDVYKEPGMEYKFKGWALDPSGVNMVKVAKKDRNGDVVLVKDPKAKETMPDYNMTLYAVWGEEEKEWEITFDPNGGTLAKLEPKDVATHKEGDVVKTTIGKKEYVMPEILNDVGHNNTKPQVVKINHRLTIKDPSWKPKKEGYDFLGWELVRYKDDGITEDDSYKEKYSVPELYAFQNEVVQDAYLKAIWVPNELVPVVAVHHFYDKDGKTEIRKPIIRDLAKKRVGSYTSAVASEQGAEYILISPEELEDNETYKKIKEKIEKDRGTGTKVVYNNEYFQTKRVDNPKMKDPQNPDEYIDNPDAFNEFHFFYRKFKTRKYKVNYFDERIKDIQDPSDEQRKTYRIINENEPEIVENGNKHFDARNYRKIPGWKLTSAPQQQLFFDLDAAGKLLGINGARGDKSDEINFYYQDIRVIERDSKDSPTPDGYHRVIFKIDPKNKGGNFGYVKDENGKDKLDGDGKKIPRTEVVYDVIDGLYSDHIPVPQELKEGQTEEEGKVYIKPDPGKNFLYWDDAKLFNKRTVIQRNYTFTAYFDWTGLKINELVRTESLKNGSDWTNNFVPTRDELVGALKWVTKDSSGNPVENDLPDKFKVKILDTDDEIYGKVKELDKTDTEELVRTVKIKASVDYGNGSVQEIEIPVKVYKNVYESLTSGAKPKVLADAEKAPDGDLVGILTGVGGKYVKVTVNPTGKPNDKDSKIYYVNPNAYVNIDEIDISADKQKLGFNNWAADDPNQNETDRRGVFDFNKRHKFTKDTVITPYFANDVVGPRPKGYPRPSEVPDYYVRVDFIRTSYSQEVNKQLFYWVNPNKEVSFNIDDPTGNTIKDSRGNTIKDAKGKEIKYKFRGWRVTNPKTDTREWKVGETVKGTFKVDTRIEAKFNLDADTLIIGAKIKDKITTPIGVTPPADNFVINKYDDKDPNNTNNLPAGTKITYEEEPDVSAAGEVTAKIKIEYPTGEVNIIDVKVNVVDDVVPQNGTDKPDVPADYVEVVLRPTDKATDNTVKIFWVNPKKEITIESTEPTGKTFEDNGINKKYNFKSWEVVEGKVNEWKKVEGVDTTIKGTFTAKTIIEAKYGISVVRGELIPAPIPKKNVVTPVGVTPNADTLIVNIPGSANDPLPDGTTITYEETPDVSAAGDITAKVKVKYPNNKTVIVNVPIKVTDNIVPEIIPGKKPNVPDDYVKVNVDTTDAATPNTKFNKTFWVKPNVEVTIPVLAPTGKAEVIDGVTRTNSFKNWKVDQITGEKNYTGEIKDSFTSETNIVAVYEFDKDIDPIPKDGQWIPVGSKPTAKEFIENHYNDGDSKNPKNLPPGTEFEYVNGEGPATDTPGNNKTVKILVKYPNGKTQTVTVTYNVPGDVVPQTGNDRPDAPTDYVAVTVVPTTKAKDSVDKVYWVNPNKEVIIPANTPEVLDDLAEIGLEFDGWDKSLSGRFTTQTTITAQYKREIKPVLPLEPGVGYIITDEGVQPKKEDYLRQLTPPRGRTIAGIEITRYPNVDSPGMTDAGLKVIYDDGSSYITDIKVFVQRKPSKPPIIPSPEPKPEPPIIPDRPYYPSHTETIIRYVEKPIEKIIKVPDNAYGKEVRYMQGFDGDFRPMDGLTRAEAAQILANALMEDGYNYNANYKISYKDIGEAWYTKAVRITSEAKVFMGYDDGYFRPQKKITRAEWISTLKRFQELSDASGNHMNLRDGHWATKEVEAAYAAGWLEIYSKGLAEFKEDEFIPRQEVAAVSNKAFDRVLDKTYIVRNEKSLISYKDVDKKMWSYEDILCASNTYLFKEGLYRAHWINEDNNSFNINTDGFEIVKDKFQRNPR